MEEEEIAAVLLLLEERTRQRFIYDVEVTTFTYFLENAPDNQFTHFFRVDRNTFQYVLSFYQPVFERSLMRPGEGAFWLDLHNRRSRLGSRKLCATRSLAFFFRSMTEHIATFDGAVSCGMSRASASRHFDFALNIMMVLTRRIPECVIDLPKDDDSAQILADRASEYVGRYNSFIGMIDGTVMDCERPGDNVWQRHMYNGMDSKHAIKNCFVFLFDGTVACCALNFAGTCHDAKLCRFIDLDKRCEHLNAKFVFAGDCAFPSQRRVLRALAESERVTLSRDEFRIFESVSTFYSRLRLSAEWGVGGLLKCWGALVYKMPADDPEKRKLLWLVGVSLWNLRVRRMGVSQILNVYSRD